MASWWEYLAFYLGFKRKQNQIEKNQQPRGFTDEKTLTGDKKIPPKKSHVFRYELPNPSTLTVDVESTSGHVLQVSVVDNQNLARMDPEAVTPVETALSATTDGKERLQGDLPAGQWAVVVYNTHESEAATAYLGVQVGGGGMASGGTKTSSKHPVLAGVLSLLMPGAGQLYNRQILRAIAAFFAVSFSYAIFTLIVSVINFGLLLLLGVVVHAGIVYDAYTTAKTL